MSIKAMTWAWGLAELPLRESMVLLALADAANDEGVCWPSQEVLAVKSRSSVRSVKRTVKALVDAGLVEVVPRSSQSGRRSNLYRVVVGAEYSASDRQRASLALSGEAVDDGPVDNPGLPRESSKGPVWHLAGVEGAQSATAGPSQSATAGTLLPYGEEPKEEPPASHATDSPEELGAGAGVAGEATARERGAARPEGAAAHPEIDHELLRACVPAPMVGWVAAGAAAVRVTAALRAARAKGWSSGQIYRLLNADPVPDQVRNRTGLVIHRVEQVMVSPPPSAYRSPVRQAPPVGPSGSSDLSPVEVEIGEAVRSLEANAAIPPGLRERLLARLSAPSGAGSGGVRR